MTGGYYKGPDIKRVKYKGKVYEVVAIRKVAQKLGHRQAQVLRSWWAKGNIPPPILKPGVDRIYVFPEEAEAYLTVMLPEYEKYGKHFLNVTPRRLELYRELSEKLTEIRAKYGLHSSGESEHVHNPRTR